MGRAKGGLREETGVRTGMDLTKGSEKERSDLSEDYLGRKREEGGCWGSK